MDTPNKSALYRQAEELKDFKPPACLQSINNLDCVPPLKLSGDQDLLPVLEQKLELLVKLPLIET